jgi:hypothetical protein
MKAASIPEFWLKAGLTELENPEAEKLNGFFPKIEILFTSVSATNRAPCKKYSGRPYFRKNFG